MLLIKLQTLNQSHRTQMTQNQKMKLIYMEALIQLQYQSEKSQSNYSGAKKWKVSGLHWVTAEMLKEVLDEISGPTSHVINKIFFFVICQPQFRKAIIMSNYKYGIKKTMKNSRLISIILNLSKIFEETLHYKNNIPYY